MMPLPTFSRIVLILLDGVGIGELPDAFRFGDEGSHTLGHICEAIGGLQLPNLQRLGLGNIEQLEGILPAQKPLACFGKMAEVSAGKDSTTGHWEIAGIVTEKPFPTYPDGFPPEIISAFETAIGKKVLGNKPASGTVIIDELGEEHLRTGCPIVYTSADSVFQIAAHEEVIPVEELYAMCCKAREILQGEHAVARVIARPFIGKPGSFQRTPRRKDFSLPPHSPTVLDLLTEHGLTVVTIGKVDEIFAGRGITEAVHTDSNANGMKVTLEEVRGGAFHLLWTTLVDFDTKFGHRNDVPGFAQALREFDAWLNELLPALHEDDLLLITADHGNDPVTASTDHSREYVPLLAYSKSFKHPHSLGTRKSLADVAATIAENFGLPKTRAGTSFLPELRRCGMACTDREDAQPDGALSV